jgi:hypothetical protein
VSYRAILSAFLLSIVAAILAADFWGSAALGPFAIGEIVGAGVFVLLLGPGASALLSSADALESSAARGELVDADRPRHGASPPSCCAAMDVGWSTKPLVARRRKGQVSPHFPDVRSPMYPTCPPSRRSMPAHRRHGSSIAAPERLVVQIEDSRRHSARFGLLPAYVPRVRIGSSDDEQGRQSL